ncbi:MAG TPA: BrnT family toxin [Phycisphaerae bacterium]|nr:BrnT family toxin [Phycisphaerae bacterium]
MALRFEWEERKAKQNLKKHGVSFEEAATVLGDPLSMTIADPVHSTVEQRWVTMGLTYRERLVVVVHTNRGSTIRLINARRATRREKTAYEEED